MERSLRILFVHPIDFFQVLGHTEPYYLFTHWSARHAVELFPLPPCRTMWKRFPPFLVFNLWSLLKLPRYLVGKPYDLIYTYKSAILLPLLMKLLKGDLWVYDLRTHPVTQSPRPKKRWSLKLDWLRSYDQMKFIANRIAFAHCDLIVTVSPGLRDRFIRDFAASPEKVHVLPLGVDCQRFHSTRPPPPSPPVPIKMVCVSSVALYRGHQTCIEAARILKERGIPLRLEFIGTGPKGDLEKLKSLSRERGLEREILWRGYVPHEALPRALEDAHIGLSPLPDIEAYRVSSPAKIFEYMAMGLVVVASDIIAHRNVLQEGENALFFKPDDASDLARQIETLYSSPAIRENLGNTAKSTAWKHDWTVLLKKLNERIAEVMSKRPRVNDSLGRE